MASKRRPVPDEPRAPAAPAALLRARLRTLLRLLPAAQQGRDEALHALRVAARRLDLAAGLLARRPDGTRVGRVRRCLRRLLRATGRARDLDVLLPLLASEAGAAGDDTAACTRRLRARRCSERRRLARRLARFDRGRLRRAVRRLARRTLAGPVACAQIEAWTRREQAELAAALVRRPRRFDGEALHAQRIRLRRLRYALELREELSGAPAGGTPARASIELRPLQERLGAIHDAHLLTQWLARQAARRGAGGRAAARRLHARLRRRVKTLHARWLALRPGRALGAPGVAREPKREDRSCV
jgi:CHAD domain-containing protein